MRAAPRQTRWTGVNALLFLLFRVVVPQPRFVVLYNMTWSPNAQSDALVSVVSDTGLPAQPILAPTETRRLKQRRSTMVPFERRPPGTPFDVGHRNKSSDTPLYKTSAIGARRQSTGPIVRPPLPVSIRDSMG
jgi:hypothetical protein